MRRTRYVMMDDARTIGDFKTLRDCFRTGFIPQHLRNFYRRYNEEGYYQHENIFVYDKLDKASHCKYLAMLVARRAQNSPNILRLERSLIRILESELGQTLTSL